MIYFKFTPRKHLICRLWGADLDFPRYVWGGSINGLCIDPSIAQSCYRGCQHANKRHLIFGNSFFSMSPQAPHIGGLQNPSTRACRQIAGNMCLPCGRLQNQQAVPASSRCFFASFERCQERNPGNKNLVIVTDYCRMRVVLSSVILAVGGAPISSD